MRPNNRHCDGDTKVVPHGAADKLFITTSGIGEILAPPPPGPTALQPGDVLIVSGPVGCHGAAILCAREQFDFEPPPDSDCAPLTAPLAALQAHVSLRAQCAMPREEESQQSFMNGDRRRNDMSH